jgi:hypothetical protein
LERATVNFLKILRGGNSEKYNPPPKKKKLGKMSLWGKILRGREKEENVSEKGGKAKDKWGIEEGKINAKRCKKVKKDARGVKFWRNSGGG